MKIIIGCSKNFKIGSKLIRCWLNTKYSHVYVRWYLSNQEREIVYQASHGMVHFQNFENFKTDNKIVKEFELDLTDEQFKKFSQKCIDLSGQPYSTLELIQIVLCDLTNGKLHAKDQNGYICSELMAELLEDFFDFKFNKPRYLLTPKDIINALSNRLVPMTAV